MSRPRKEFNSEQFEKLCALQCTETEVASFFEMGVTALVARCKDYFGMSFQEVRSFYAGEGKVSLRRYQFELSKRSPAMAKWLGMQWLGQRYPKSEVQFECDHMVRKESAVIINVVPVVSAVPQPTSLQPGTA